MLLSLAASAAEAGCDESLEALSSLPPDGLPMASGDVANVLLAPQLRRTIVRIGQYGIDIDVLVDLPSPDPAIRRSRVDSASGAYGSILLAVPAATAARLCIRAFDDEHSQGTVFLVRFEPTPEFDRAVTQRLAAESAAEPGWEQYAESAQALERAGEIELAAEAWIGAGRLAKVALANAQAEHALRQAVALAREIDDEVLLAWAQYFHSQMLSIAGEVPTALARTQAVLEQQHAPGELRASLQAMVAILHQRQGYLSEAESYYRRALATLQDYPNAIRSATIHNNLGGLRMQRGEYRRASQEFEASAQEYEAAGNLKRARLSRVNQGKALSRLGQYRQAIAIVGAELASLLREDSYAEFERIDALDTLGAAFEQMGDLERARDYYLAAYELVRATRGAGGLARLEHRLGRLEFDRDEYEQAGRHLANALERYERANDPGSRAGVVCDLAQVALAGGDRWGARESFEELADLLQLALDRALPTSTACLRYVDGLLSAKTSPSHALVVLAEAQRLAEGSGQLRLALRATTHAVRISLDRLDPALALATLDMAEPLVARIRAQAPGGALLREVNDATRGLLDLRIEALLMQDRPGAWGRAFEASAAERALILRTGFEPAGQRHLRQRLHRLRQEQARRRTAAAPGARSLEEILVEIAAVEQELAQAAPAALAAPDGASALAAVQANLDAQSVLLYFHVAQRRGWVWVIERNEMRLRAIPGEDALRPAVVELRAALSQPGAPEAGRMLAGVLLRGFEEALAGRNVYVMADRSLHLVPFAALPIRARGQTRYLAEAAQLIGVAHPAAAGNEAFDISAIAGLLASDRELRAAGWDKSALRQTYQNRGVEVRFPTIGDRSSVERALVQEVDVIHVAGHAFADPGASGLSEIVFQGGADPVAISAIELAGLRLRASLVVLNACETGVGRVSATEGPVSLAYALFQAGAKEVISTLWRVDDFAAGEFSAFFYQALAEGGGPAEALRRAQRSMLAQRRWADPHYWGAFALLRSPRAAAAPAPAPSTAAGPNR